MYHPDASEPINVSEGSQTTAEKRGWTTEKPQPAKPAVSHKSQLETQQKKPAQAED
jgi:hypothetical protein